MFQSISAANRTSGWLMSMILSSAGSSRSFWRSSRGLLIAFPNVDDTLRESRITQKQNPKTQESEVQLPAFLQNRILHQDQFRLFPSPICILHGRLDTDLEINADGTFARSQGRPLLPLSDQIDEFLRSTGRSCQQRHVTF